MSLATPEVNLARRGRSLVMTLTYASDIAAKHAGDAMATSLEIKGAGVVEAAPAPASAKRKMSRQEKIFLVFWCAANTAASVAALLASGNGVASCVLVLLLLVNIVALLIAVVA